MKNKIIDSFFSERREDICEDGNNIDLLFYLYIFSNMILRSNSWNRGIIS